LRSAAPSCRKPLRAGRHTAGAVSVEFALIAPVLITLILIAADFGVGMYEQQVIANAARAGAQYAALSTANAQDEGEIQTAVANAAQKDAADLETTSRVFCQCQDGTSVTCTETCDGDPPEVYVRITVSFQHETLLSYPSLDNPMTLTGESEFRLR
jgi:Flp pilus assembly protein TadG